MRGTTSKADFDLFASAVACFPPSARHGKTAQAVFEEGYEALSALAKKKPPFARAIGWKAYVLALSVHEEWSLPPKASEAKMSAQARLDEALRLAQMAVKQDETDHDLHWALADVHLIRGEFKDSVAAFEEAIKLNRDERHPSLFVDAATAMMQAGDFDRAETLFRKARMPDWHNWSRGIFLFLKAGRATADRETFLNLALDELKATRMQIGDDFYQSEVQLVLAAVHWRKAELFDQKAASTKDPADHALFTRLAAQSRGAAARAIQGFHGAFHHWSPAVAGMSLPLDSKTDTDWWQDTVKALWSIP